MVGNGQSQSDVLRAVLGCEVGVENMRLLFLGDAHARILYVDAHVAACRLVVAERNGSAGRLRCLPLGLQLCFGFLRLCYHRVVA